MPDEPPIVKTAEDARQGRTGTNLRYILLASLVLAILAVAAAMLTR